MQLVGGYSSKIRHRNHEKSKQESMKQQRPAWKMGENRLGEK